MTAGDWPFGVGRCHCGCGEKTRLAKHTDHRRGHVKGQPVKYVAHHFAHNGGRWIDPDGYTMRRRPGHSRARGNGYVAEHILVVEAALGRPVPLGRPVHHVNHDRSDNRGMNLVLCENDAYHKLLHQRQRALDMCGHPDWLCCSLCTEYGPPESMYVDPRGRGRHRACRAAYAAKRRRVAA